MTYYHDETNGSGHAQYSPSSHSLSSSLHSSTNAYTTTFHGVAWTHPRARHRVELFDLERDHVAWMGDSLTKGNGWTTTEDVIDMLARETVERLRAEGLIAGSGR